MREKNLGAAAPLRLRETSPRRFIGSLASVAPLVFSWNQVWPRLHTPLLHLGCLLAAVVDHIDHTCLEGMA